MAAALPLAVVSCSREELPSASCEDGVCPLSITVADGGYGAADGQTKAVENGYRTEFTAGDECGLYIVRGGTVVYNNVKLTATAGADGSLTWQPEARVTLAGGFSDERYFLYYPYQSDMSGKTTVSAIDAEVFFAPLISGWQPAADQSTYAAYTASDLMTATGTAVRTNGSISLSFSMTHRMALAVIEMPPTVYKFTNTDVTIPDYTVASSADFSSGAVKPCCIAPGTYRYIFYPVSGTAASITGSYDEGNKEFTVSPNDIATGSCKTYKIDGGRPIEKSHNLQVGDFLMKDGSLLSKGTILNDAQKANVSAIVFHAGQHSNDQSDYSQSGIGKKNCRGYAVALADATSDYCMWGVYGTALGCCPTDNSGNKQNNYQYPDVDWNGYNWTQTIITAAGGKNSLNATDSSCYPATYYAVVAYEDNCPAPTGSSGWFLPSIGQLWEVYQQRNSLTSVDGSSLRDDDYWSSSEYYIISPKWTALCVREGYVGGWGKHRSYCYVRAILAF